MMKKVIPETFPPLTISRPDLREGESDARFRQTLYRLIEAASRLSGLREGFGRHIQLTASQFLVIVAAAYHDASGGITIIGLSQSIGLAPPHVTTEVGRLIRRGLLEKQPHERDRRSVLVRLSPAGRVAIERVLPVVRQINDVLFDGISAEDLATARRVSEALIRNSDYAALALRQILDTEAQSPTTAPSPRE